MYAVSARHLARVQDKGEWEFWIRKKPTSTLWVATVGYVDTLSSIMEVLSAGALSAGGGVGVVPTLVSQSEEGAELDMVQEGGGAASDGLIAPRRVPNPCLESPQRMDLHRELLFNQKIGKNVLNQKSELERALSKHKEKQILNQVKEHKETPELERAIAERARRLEQAELAEASAGEAVEEGANATLQQLRARLRHAAPAAPAASAASAH